MSGAEVISVQSLQSQVLYPKGNGTGKDTHLSDSLCVHDSDSLTNGWRIYAKYNIQVKHQCGGADIETEKYKVVEGAICLMMISRGVRSLDELKLVFSRQPDFAFSDCEYFGTYENNAEFEVLANESIGYGSFVNESELGLKKDLTVGYGSGQLKMNLVESCDQDFGDRDGTGSGILLELKRRYKNHVCAICYKKFGSAQALGSHKRVHNKAENKISGVNSSDVEFKLTWVIGYIARSNGTHLLW
ncbi:putative ubiquitinyl hydrolase 1 [Tanacetum coccineum]